MTTKLFQFFESVDKTLLQQQMNEFSASLKPQFFEIVEVRLQEPHWDRALIIYQTQLTPEQMQEEALKELEKERLKKEAEQQKEYSDEDLQKIVEENAKTEKSVDSFNMSAVAKPLQNEELEVRV